MNYGIFWDEYHSVKQSHTSNLPCNPDLEDGQDRKEDQNDSSLEWLHDAGFRNIAKKIQASHQIDQNDDDMKLIAASLTRSQAEAVRRRIASLNEAIRLRKLNKENPLPSKIHQKRKDVRNIFTPENIQTRGETTESNEFVALTERQISPTPDAANSDDKSRRSSGGDSSRPLRIHISSSARDIPRSNKAVVNKPKLVSTRSVDTSVSKVNNNVSPSSHHQKGSPKMDNLVRRTSASQFTIKTGEQRDQYSSSTGNRYIEKRVINIERPKSTSSYVSNENYNRKSISRGESPYINMENTQGKEDVFTNIEKSSLQCDSFNDEQNVDSNKCRTYNKEEVDEYFENIEKTINLQIEETQHDNLTFSNNSNTYQSNLRRSTSEIRPPDLSNRDLSSYHDKAQNLPPSQSLQDFRKSDNIRENIQEVALKKVVVDSTYINLSTIENNYPTTTSSKSIPSISDLNVSKSEVSEWIKSSSQIVNKDDEPLIPSKKVSTKTNSSPLPSRPSPFTPKNLETKRDYDNHQMHPQSRRTLSTDDVRKQSPVSLPRSFNSSSNISTSSSSTPVTSPRSGQSMECLEGDAKLEIGSSHSKESLAEESGKSAAVINGPSFPPLPNFTLAKEELGMTKIGDLSEEDMTKVRSLALIELSALFDAHEIPMNRKKSPSKLKSKDTGVFGVPLTILCQREQENKNDKVAPPRIFREMMRYIEQFGLDEGGLLRIPGAVQRVKAFREEADKNIDSPNLWNGKKVSDIATCLKQFLRDLPIPLLSYEYQSTFTSVGALSERKVQLQALNLLVLLLNPIHQETLKMLLIFLNKIVMREHKNKMGLNNVAMIMAPNLFFHNNNSSKLEVGEAQKAASMTDIMRMLIKYQPILWTIPVFMVNQIRCLNEESPKNINLKNVRKIIRRRMNKSDSQLRGKSPGSSGEDLEEIDENLIIRVKAPSMNKQSMAVQLSTNTTAGEVVAKFQWKRQHSVKEKDEIDSSRLKILRSRREKKENRKDMLFYLYEAGGNIGERKLEATANLVAILKVNPNAEWVLKSEAMT